MAAPTQKHKRTQGKKAKDSAIVVALISAMATIIVALFNFPPFMALFEKTPTPTFTETAFPTLTLETPLVADTPTATLTPFPLPTATFTPTPGPQIFVVLEPSRTDGPAPLSVNFKAKNSYARFPDGSVWDCVLPNVCRFIWNITREGQQVVDPIHTSEGMLSFTFTARGTYLVTVTVCRGDICNGDGVFIEAR